MISFDHAEQLVNYCDSYSRLPSLIDLEPVMDEGDWLRVLGGAWTCCDNIGHYIDDLTETPLARRQGPILEMMTAEEQLAYDALPDKVRVYRGCYKNNKWGLSWSLSKDVAKKFPTLGRYRQIGQQPILVTALAEKQNIIALKLDRDESELITWRPKHLSTWYIPIPQAYLAS